MKHINSFLFEGKAATEAKTDLLMQSRKFDFDYDKVYSYFCDDQDSILDYFDRQGYTNKQVTEYIETVNSFLTDKETYDREIGKLEAKKQKEEIKQKKLVKTEVVKKFLQEIIDNEIMIIVKDSTNGDKRYNITCDEDGNICLR